MPERLEISHARNEKDHSLDAPYVENFSHTEYQSEATVYAYLKQVSDFLKRYQELDAEYALLPPEPYDPQNYLLQWRLHMRELINELFNMFVGGNLFSTAAMTRTLMECCVYGKVLKQEKSARLLEDWFLCGMIRSLPGQDGALRQAKLKTVYALCSAWNREPEETIRRFKKGNENEWLVSVIPGKGRIYFSHVCEYLQETRALSDVSMGLRVCPRAGYPLQNASLHILRLHLSSAHCDDVLYLQGDPPVPCL